MTLIPRKGWGWLSPRGAGSSGRSVLRLTFSTPDDWMVGCCLPWSNPHGGRTAGQVTGGIRIRGPTQLLPAWHLLGLRKLEGRTPRGVGSLWCVFLLMRLSARCVSLLICTWEVLGIFFAWKHVAGGSCISKRDREGALGGTWHSYVSSAIQLSISSFSSKIFFSVSVIIIQY